MPAIRTCEALVEYSAQIFRGHTDTVVFDMKLDIVFFGRSENLDGPALVSVFQTISNDLIELETEPFLICQNLFISDIQVNLDPLVDETTLIAADASFGDLIEILFLDQIVI